jgi:DNA modification methylase
MSDFARSATSSFVNATHHRRAFSATNTRLYLLAKGDVQPPVQPIPDVIDFRYTGNKLHPTQKPTSALAPLISSFSQQGGVVLDPIAGSGSTLVAAKRDHW